MQSLDIALKGSRIKAAYVLINMMKEPGSSKIERYLGKKEYKW